MEESEAEKQRAEKLISVAEGKTDYYDICNLQQVVWKAGEYVVFQYEEELFPEKIIHFNNKKANIVLYEDLSLLEMTSASRSAQLPLGRYSRTD